MFQTLMGVLTAFIGLTMQSAAGRKFYDSNIAESDLREFIGSCIQIVAVTSILTLLLLYFFGNHLSGWLGLEKKWLLIAGLTTTSTIILQVRLVQWQVRKKAKLFGLIFVSKGLLNLLLSLILVVALLKGSAGRMSAQFGSAAIFAILALWLLKRDNLLTFFIWKPKFIHEALKFGVPLIPHMCGVFLLSTVDRFLINLQLGLDQAGIYMVAVQFGVGVFLLFDAVNKAYVPWLFERLKRNDINEKRQIVFFTYIWFAFILCGAGLAFLVGPGTVTFVAGNEYSKAGDVVGWIVLGQVFGGGMYLMVTNYIFFSKRTGLLSIVTICSGLINLVLLFFLIDHFGLEGAAYAFCVSMAIRFLLTWYVAQKRHPMPWFNLKTQS